MGSAFTTISADPPAADDQERTNQHEVREQDIGVIAAVKMNILRSVVRLRPIRALKEPTW